MAMSLEYNAEGTIKMSAGDEYGRSTPETPVAAQDEEAQEKLSTAVFNICQDDPDRVQHGIQLLKNVLAEGRADVNAWDDGGRTAISRIIEANNTEAAKLLKQAKADPTIPDERPHPLYKTPLENLLLHNTQTEMIAVIGYKYVNGVLIGTPAVPKDSNAQERLSEAVYNICQNDPDRVAYGITLLKSALADPKVEVNAWDDGGRTAISRIVDAKNTEAAKLLKQAGADPNIPDERPHPLYKTPLENLLLHNTQTDMIAVMGYKNIGDVVVGTPSALKQMGAGDDYGRSAPEVKAASHTNTSTKPASNTPKL